MKTEKTYLEKVMLDLLVELECDEYRNEDERATAWIKLNQFLRLHIDMKHEASEGTRTNG